jgi:hypothetical protein
MQLTSITLHFCGHEQTFVPADEAAQEAIQAAIESSKTEIAKPPKIGEFWQGQGGIYAGLIRGENGLPDYHLIIPTDPLGYVESITWGGYGKEEVGTNSTFDGLANTTALDNSEIKHPAAQWAAGLVIDGHKDFYLPARRELRLLWVNVPELFVNGWYWSSTQYSAYFAFYQDFDVGFQSSYYKYGALRARAVRRLLVIE